MIFVSVNMDVQIDQSCKKQDIDDHVGIENRQENEDPEKNGYWCTYCK
jgi:hypothetical protein